MPDKNNIPKQIPTSLLQAALRLFWPPNTRKKKFALSSVIFVVVCFTIWVSAIPDTIKTEIIHFVKEKVTNRPEQPQKEEQTKITNTLIINQHTEGDQSPAIISNDVNIIYDAPKDKKTKE